MPTMSTAYDNGAMAVMALMNGQIDAVVIDNAPAQEFVKANEGLKILDHRVCQRRLCHRLCQGQHRPA